MCGIAATCGPVDGAERVPRMLTRIAHRGPDDEGLHRIGDAWLGHRRLSIVDPAGGHQPLVTSSGDRALVGNGEIYNHRELRRLLPDACFSTSSDNELVLHLVDATGPAQLADLRGMYAFAVAGAEPGAGGPDSFLACRDPVGIKPLFWWHDGDRAVFGSELGAFDEDLRAGVEPFPPGCYWSPETGVRRFADAIPPRLREPGSVPSVEPPPGIYAELREQLITAVRRRLMADVDVGVFISGGLDSSLVAAIATHLAGPLPSFSVGLPRSPDLLAARQVAEALGTDHHEALLDADALVADVPEVVRRLAAFDPATVRAAVANDLLAAEAARRVKVVLTGEGADELFAGYRHLATLDPAALHAEQCHEIDELHRLNLQRADHLTMAHGLEARVPYLDLDLIAFTLGLPPEWRAPRAGAPGRPASEPVAKHLLRTAFEGWLPGEVLWRDKVQFGDGSGVGDVLRERMAGTVSEAELSRLREVAPVPLRDAEEAAYYRLFAEHHGPGSAAQVAQFATTSEPT